MAGDEKPYRVYHGGRARGPVRHAPRERPGRERRAEEAPDAGDGYRLPEPERRRPRVGRVVLVVVLLLLVLVVVWSALGYFSFRRGVGAANDRLDPQTKQALAPAGSVLSAPANMLLLGTDKGAGKGREGPGRADSIVLVRTDPDENRIAFLSIPRDLRVEIPGHGPDKINAAYALGGSPLMIQTVQRLTNLPVNHVAEVDFGRFAELIDALGGVRIAVPKRILSNRFDCPFRTPAECERWQGWRFEPGPQTLDGRRALTYSRIRENRLDPAESDLTRGGRQQQVLQAIADETVSFGTFLRLPWAGEDLLAPLATDLSTGQFLQLAWVKFRTPSSGTLRCRLGGTPTQIGSGSYIIGSEENVSVIAMVTGRTAPQPPPPGSGPFGPGCRVGTS